MRIRKGFLLNAGLAVVAVAVTLAMALAADAWLNLGLRYALARLFERNVQEPEPIMYVYDKATGWRLNPNTQYHRSRSGPFFGLAGLESYDTRLRVNSEGFIDRDHYLETPYYRIAFVGSSWVEAVQHEYTDRFTPLTEDYVFDRSGGTKVVEVMNFGISNAAPAQAYGAIKTYAIKYKPDEVWLFLTSQDLRANTPVDTPPPFGPTFVYGDGGTLSDIRFGYVDPPAYARAKRRRELDAIGASGVIFSQVMPYHYSSEINPIYERVWQHMRIVVGLIKKTLDTQAIRLRVVYIPSVHEIDTKRWDEYRREARRALGRDLPMDPTNAEKRFTALTKDLGVELISLAPLCREKGTQMYSDHFSRMGHHWVAEQLARVIIDTVPDQPKTAPR